MNLKDRVKKELVAVWELESNRQIIKDVALLAVATIVFHFLYWYSGMNDWIFGPFTQSVYDFFRRLAFNLSLIPCKAFIDKPFDISDTTYYFYEILPNGFKYYNKTMEINIDCSGVKQLLQFLLIMVLCRGNWWRKGVYFVVGCLVILFFNVVRIYLLTSIFADNPHLFKPIHDWIARPMMYIIIFSLWLIWISYFAKRKQKSSKPLVKIRRRWLNIRRPLRNNFEKNSFFRSKKLFFSIKKRVFFKFFPQGAARTSQRASK